MVVVARGGAGRAAPGPRGGAASSVGRKMPRTPAGGRRRRERGQRARRRESRGRRDARGVAARRGRRRGARRGEHGAERRGRATLWVRDPCMFRPRVADVQQDESSTTSRSTSTDDVVFEASARGRQHANPLPAGRAPPPRARPRARPEGMLTFALAPAAYRARVRALVARAAPRRALAPRPRRGGPSVVRRRRDAPRAAVREPVPARDVDVDESARVQRDLAARASSRRRRGGSRARPGAARTTRPATGPDRPPRGASRDESYSGDAVSSFLDDSSSGAVFAEARSRGQWLLGLLVLQSSSSVVLQQYADLVRDNIVITLFLTMLVGAGGKRWEPVRHPESSEASRRERWTRRASARPASCGNRRESARYSPPPSP